MPKLILLMMLTTSCQMFEYRKCQEELKQCRDKLFETNSELVLPCEDDEY